MCRLPTMSLTDNITCATGSPVACAVYRDSQSSMSPTFLTSVSCLDKEIILNCRFVWHEMQEYSHDAYLGRGDCIFPIESGKCMQKLKNE